MVPAASVNRIQSLSPPVGSANETSPVTTGSGSIKVSASCCPGPPGTEGSTASTPFKVVAGPPLMAIVPCPFSLNVKRKGPTGVRADKPGASAAPASVDTATAKLPISAADNRDLENFMLLTIQPP